MAGAVGERGLPVTFEEFWPEYVCAHGRVATRVVHTLGTLAGWMILGAALTSRRWWWIAGALAVPYGLAWISHFFIEHNRPASFEHPLWSGWADQRMVFLTLVGRMGAEVRRCEEMRWRVAEQSQRPEDSR